jgi:hypothetical protein
VRLSSTGFYHPEEENGKFGFPQIDLGWKTH